MNPMPEYVAGRELDALIAEKVMEWIITTPIDATCDHAVGTKRDGSSAWRNFGRCPGATRDAVIPLYSTDIAAAWEVVEKFELSAVGVEFLEPSTRLWRCRFWLSDKLPEFREATAETAPLAICRAALAAVGIE